MTHDSNSTDSPDSLALVAQTGLSSDKPGGGIVSYAATLIAGAAIGAAAAFWLAPHTPAPVEAGVFAPATLPGWHSAFESLAGGTDFKLVNPGGAELQVDLLATFYDLQEQPCRGFRVRSGPALGRQTHGVACRSASGRWQVAGIAYDGSEAHPSQRDDEGYVHASARSESVYQMLVDGIASSSPLSADHERGLIRRAWQAGSTR